MPVSSTDLELVKNSAFFDVDEYTKEHPDVNLSGMSAIEHYLQVGGFIGRNPGPEFDSAAYLEAYRDVAARGENPLLHFERHGRGEGRSPRPVTHARNDEMTRLRVDIIVPVCNALTDVKACLASLSETPADCPVRVLVINDGSDAETTAWLREACATLGTDSTTFELIEHPENRGYTRAVNTGLKTSDAPFVVTLNSDTIVTKNWLEGLIRCMRSDPGIGIVGPLSNAASWQNVPDLYGLDGKFAINALPEGLTPNDMADIVRHASRRIYPRSTFVNGFCFMIRRAVIDAVGYLDEVAFPTGYGEENDFCMRAQDAGFELAYADDTYVFHAKSKSFGSVRREALARAGGDAIKAKHGEEKFGGLLARVARTDQMDEVRRRIRTVLNDSRAGTAERTVEMITRQRVLFILPVRGGGGGAHSVVQEVAAMRRLGVDAKVAIRAGDLDDFMRLYGDIENAEALFAPFTDRTLLLVASGYDIAVATIFTSVKLVAEIVEALPWILPAYYVQDYEPLFFEEGDPLRNEAYESYTRIPGAFLFAKTSWICRTIEKAHDVPVCKVEPSIDHEVYSLEGPRVAEADGTICVTAMIRPRTPRRGAARTMKLLSMLKARFGAQVTIRIFGCDENSPDFLELDSDFEFVSHGILTRPEVAALLRSANVFIDLSDYQAFGRTGLEAMACGALAVVPQAGGGSEYAIDGLNAVVVDSLDVQSAADKIIAVLGDRAQVARLQLRAIETASRYSPHRAAIKELTVLAPALCARRETYPKPERPRVLLMPDEQTEASRTLPGLGNERLPSPYCRAELLAQRDVQVLPAGQLPEYAENDIAILQGNPSARHGPEFASWLADWKAHGGRIVYDLAEDPDMEPDVDETLADEADVITVSSETITACVTERRPGQADKVMVVPNYPDKHLWQTAKIRYRGNATLQIGYFGSEANLADLESIKPALEEIQARHAVEIKVVGCYETCPPIIGEKVTYLGRRHQPGFHQSDFIAWLKQVATWDIVLVPDRVDVDLKFMRSTTLGGAIVCRKDPAVSGFARHAENCLLVDDDVAAWKDAIELLMTDSTLRQRLRRNARQGAIFSWSQQSQGKIYDQVLNRAGNDPQHTA